MSNLVIFPTQIIPQTFPDCSKSPHDLFDGGTGEKFTREDCRIQYMHIPWIAQNSILHGPFFPFCVKREILGPTCVLFLQPLHSYVWFLRFAMHIRPHKLQTWTLYGSETSKSLSLKNWAAPWAIWQSLSISPNLKPPSLKTIHKNTNASNGAILACPATY